MKDMRRYFLAVFALLMTVLSPILKATDWLLRTHPEPPVPAGGKGDGKRGKTNPGRRGKVVFRSVTGWAPRMHMAFG